MSISGFFLTYLILVVPEKLLHYNYNKKGTVNLISNSPFISILNRGVKF